jgi:hypothetical protein
MEQRCSIHESVKGGSWQGAAGSLGLEGIRPTYMITKAILEKIFNQ